MKNLLLALAYFIMSYVGIALALIPPILLAIYIVNNCSDYKIITIDMNKDCVDDCIYDNEDDISIPESMFSSDTMARAN